MKKKAILLLSILCFTIVFSAIAYAANTASLTGSSTVRAGDSLTLTFTLNGTNMYAVETVLKYDTSKLTYSSASAYRSGWAVDINSDTAGKVKVVASDDKLANPISSSAKVFTVTFTVKSGLATGTSVSVEATGISASNGSQDFAYEDTSYNINIAAPKSSDAKLSRLSVSGYTISPDFSPDITSYSMGIVPNSVSSLSVSAACNDSKATYAISGTSLSVGNNTVKVSVTAENGATKVYSISVTRERPAGNSDASLKSITAGSGTLSPVFNSSTLSYIIYVPYETTMIRISGTPTNAYATCTAPQDTVLKEGDNIVTLTCMASDNFTKGIYTVHVYRMPAFNGTVPAIGNRLNEISSEEFINSVKTLSEQSLLYDKYGQLKAAIAMINSIDQQSQEVNDALKELKTEATNYQKQVITINEEITEIMVR